MCHLANKWLIINGKENLIAEILLVTRMGSNVIPLGFEPKTHSLEGCCSIQLSYGTNIAKLI